MAVDQAILESVNDSGLPVLRIYRWSPATLSLGYFQTYEDRSRHLESVDCEVVRRASGGGAIIHDQEITYSLTLPSANRWALQNTQIYRIVHDEITAVLNDYSVTVVSYDSTMHEAPKNENSFLCFQRRSDGDLICGNYKVVGSAQRRSKQAVLQHGSILMQTSKFAPQLPGIFQLANTKFEPDEFCERLVAGLCHVLGFESETSAIDDAERKIAESYVKQRFENDDWTIRRKKHNLEN